MAGVAYEQFKMVIEDMTPFSKKVGIKLDSMEERKCELSLKFDQTNTSPMGTLHAGPPFVLAELAGATLLSASVDMGKFQVINKGVDIRFKRPCMGDIFVKLEMDEESVKKIEAEAEANGKTDATVPVEITDADGKVLVVADTIYQVRKM